MIGLIKGTARQVKSVSGLPLPIATYNGNLKAPIKKLSLSINPTQSGTGDPYPAGGGKNILNMTAENGQAGAGYTAIGVEGNITLESTATYGRVGYVVEGLVIGETYTFSADIAHTVASSEPSYIYFNDAIEWRVNYGSLSMGSTTSGSTPYRKTIVATSTTLFIGFYITAGNAYGDVIVVKNAQVEKGSSATNYAPFSNIRPITGVSSVNVARTGKNFIDLTLSNLEQGGINGNTGALESANNRVRNANYYPFPFDTLYDTGVTITIPSGYRLAMRFYDKNGSYISGTGSPIGFITELQSYFYGKGVEFVKFVFARMDNANITPSDISALTYQLEIGSTGTAYEPYTGNTYTIDLDGTRYGGTIDIVDGEAVMTVTHKYWTENGSANWDYQTTGGERYFVGGISQDSDGSTNGLSNYGLLVSAFSQTGVCVQTNGRINLCGNLASAFTDVPDLKAKLAQTPIQVVYKLATPFTVNLGSLSIPSLLGQNNIWHDGNGDVDELVYVNRQLYYGR